MRTHLLSAVGKFLDLERRVFAWLGGYVAPRSLLQRYALAIAVVGLATVGRWVLLPTFGARYPFVTLFPTVLVASVLAGFGPGVMASVLIFSLAGYWSLPGIGHFSVADPVDRMAMMINFGGTIMVCFVAEVLRRAIFELNRSQAALEQLVEQRTGELRAEIARREKVELELRAASAAKDRFLATLSHELRTPLSPVLLLSSDGAANPRLPAEVRDDFREIARNVQLEARLIDDLLDVTRIVHGKVSLQRERLDLHAVLAVAVARTAADLKARQLALVQDFAATRPHVQGDAGRLEQVFCNLLGNAAKFTPAGQVTLRTANAGDTVCVDVVDTGIGLTAEEIARIFTPFAQGDQAAHGLSSGGLGLGLSIVRGLLELHGGTVAVSSEGRNRGASFCVRLPVCAENVAGAGG